MGLIHPLGIFNGVSTALQGMDLARGHQHYKTLLSSTGISPKLYWDVHCDILTPSTFWWLWLSSSMHIVLSNEYILPDFQLG